MAVMTLNYQSTTIGMQQNLTVILPEDASYFDTQEPVKRLPSLLLLHGLSSDETCMYVIPVLKDMRMTIN